jgi:hypothetical protein
MTSRPSNLNLMVAARAVLTAWDAEDALERLDLDEVLWETVENLRRAVADTERLVA